MNDFFIYLLKSSAILGIFWGVYELFLRRETFFRVIRVYLITGIVLAISLPALEWVEYVDIVYTPTPLLDYSSLQRMPAEELDKSFRGLTLSNALLAIYGLGLLYILGRRVLSLYHLTWLRRLAVEARDNGLKVFNVSGPIPPFSFFNRIYWNPNLYDEGERLSILRHEEAHCRQWHSLDILLMEAGLMLLWWNPVAWLYRKILRQNLEYLADQTVSFDGIDKTSYQYAMLKLSAPEHAPLLASNFNNSFIKKRILMLNRKPSHPRKIWLFTLVLPLLALFLYSFNRTEVVRYIPGGGAFPESVLEDMQIEIEFAAETTDAELEEIKRNLAKDNIDLSYTVVRGDKGQITSIELNVTGKFPNGKKVSSTYISDGEGKPIDRIVLQIDSESGSVSIGAKGKKVFMDKNGDKTVRTEVRVISEDEEEDVDVLVSPDADADVEFFIDSTGNTTFSAKKIIVHTGKEKGEGGTYIFRSNTKSNPQAQFFTVKPHRKGGDHGPVILHRGWSGESNVEVLRMPTDRKSYREFKRKAREAMKNKGQGEEIKYLIIDGDRQVMIDGMDFNFDFDFDSVEWKQSMADMKKNMAMAIDSKVMSEALAETFESPEWKEKLEELKEMDIELDEREIQKIKAEAQREAMRAQREAQRELIEMQREEIQAQREKIQAEREAFQAMAEKEIIISLEEGDPLYLIDGKEKSKRAIERLDKDKIEQVDVLKGKAAVEKYGEKAKDGVISVTTKK